MMVGRIQRLILSTVAITAFGCSSRGATVDGYGAAAPPASVDDPSDPGGAVTRIEGGVPDGGPATPSRDGSVSAEAGSDASPPEPCPTGGALLDCSRTCGPTSTSCDGLGCSHFDKVLIDARDAATTHYLRTAGAPFTQQECTLARSCGGPMYAPVQSMVVAIDAPGRRVIRVAPPWYLSRFLGSGDQWCRPQNPALEVSCFVADDHAGDPINFAVLTSDPDAPARNVVIDGSQNAACP
jgi:hypothetical protein